jgi:glutamine synthetase
MGPDLVRAYLAIRRDEVRRWEETGNEWSVEAITDWELTEYLPFF